MRVQSQSYGRWYSPGTRHLMNHVVSPLTGISSKAGLTLRSKYDPRVIVTGGLICNVKEPGSRSADSIGSYHIGAVAHSMDHALLKTYAESLERYTQYTFDPLSLNSVFFGSYSQAKKESGGKLLDLSTTLSYGNSQLSDKNFPFRNFSVEDSFLWIPMRCERSDEKVLVPAQYILTGYQIQTQRGEPWIHAAVTTGTAAHRTHALAYMGAFLELTQLDAVMGNWYSDQVAVEIDLDTRVNAVKLLIDKQFKNRDFDVRFYLIENPSYPTFNVACKIENKARQIPRFAIGLGSAFSLSEAIYKSFLEACGVFQLVKTNLAFSNLSDFSTQEFRNLDDNVSYYAMGMNDGEIEKKFPNGKAMIRASHVRNDCIIQDPLKQVDEIKKWAHQAGHKLYYLNLTQPGFTEAGIHVVRLWSPDLLSLCLPSYPEKINPRYQSYGGFNNEHPHPYP